MNEGINLKNIAEVHVLDVSFNIARIEQVIGRAIRWCSHYALMNNENKLGLRVQPCFRPRGQLKKSVVWLLTLMQETTEKYMAFNK